MRFAGQRFREGRHGMPNFREQDHALGDMSYRPQVQGLEQSMNQMPEKNASSFTKTAEPTHGKKAVIEPEFRA